MFYTEAATAEILGQYLNQYLNHKGKIQDSGNCTVLS